MQEHTPLRVAIIGGGITGLTAAYDLTNTLQESHVQPIEVTIYESASYLGGLAAGFKRRV